MFRTYLVVPNKIWHGMILIESMKKKNKKKTKKKLGS